MEKRSIKEDLILPGDLMVNQIKILITARLRKEKQLITVNKMIIKNVVDKHHKNKKEKMKTKKIRNRLKAISIKRINKMTYRKT